MRAVLVAGLVAACSGPTPAERARPAASLSPEAYDRWRRPDALVAALALRPGARVADVGAGAGYLTFRLARAVGPGGRVIATDIDPAALVALTAARAGHPAEGAWVRVRAVAADDPGLEPGAYDLVLLAEVDHLLPDRAGYLARTAAALAPGGRIAVANRAYRRRDLARDAAAAGLRAADAAVDLPGQFLVFLEPR
jgi:SAM-dependent methyltransferase